MSDHEEFRSLAAEEVALREAIRIFATYHSRFLEVIWSLNMTGSTHFHLQPTLLITESYSHYFSEAVHRLHLPCINLSPLIPSFSGDMISKWFDNVPAPGFGFRAKSQSFLQRIGSFFAKSILYGWYLQRMTKNIVDEVRFSDT